MYRPNIGNMSKKISIGHMDKIINDNGFMEETFIEDFKAYAFVKNLHAKEFWEAKQNNLEHTVKFLVRFNSKIDYDKYIKFNGKLYEILFIDNIDYQNAYIEIKANTIERGVI